MKAKHKSILAGGLGALATVVWVPQLLSGGSGEEPVADEVSAELPDGAQEAPDASDPTAAEEESPQEEAPRTSEEEQGVAGSAGRLAALEESLGALARRDSGDLAALLARLEAGDERDPLEESLFVPDVDPVATGEDARAWLEEFAGKNPLTGLIHGPDRSAALLGHRVVRPGEALLGGRITVVAIGPGWVELASEGAQLRVELPAFRARSSPGVSVPPLPAPVERGA